ncbi:serine/arginine repetitive matrix protein 1-like [Ananas comosus]|uniref:Serine/arginine repetitive matrix protein 1-like n=1 Tax=Ananas comosus TaxID=4615 RepID=A0A6P5H2X0_ANACO|nr:serine/arginine repetitive matrix protein 1-like [Ananas comosus]
MNMQYTENDNTKIGHDTSLFLTDNEKCNAAVNILLGVGSEMDLGPAWLLSSSSPLLFPLHSSPASAARRRAPPPCRRRRASRAMLRAASSLSLPSPHAGPRGPRPTCRCPPQPAIASRSHRTPLRTSRRPAARVARPCRASLAHLSAAPRAELRAPPARRARCPLPTARPVAASRAPRTRAAAPRPGGSPLPVPHALPPVPKLKIH